MERHAVSHPTSPVGEVVVLVSTVGPVTSAGTGTELFDLGWANQSALGLICATCGFVHEFHGDAVSLGKRDEGCPAR